MGDFDDCSVREAPVRKAPRMAAAVAEDIDIGKVFVPVEDAKKALSLEKDGKEIVWADNIKTLTEMLRDRSGINNVVAFQDCQYGGSKIKVYELNAPVFTNPLDVKSAVKGGGKAILYTISESSNDHFDAIKKVIEDGTIKSCFRIDEYVRKSGTAACSTGIRHAFSLLKSYDKAKAKEASKRRKAWIVQHGRIDCNDLNEVFGILIRTVRDYYSFDGFHYFVNWNWQRPKEREAIYKAVIILSRRIDQLVYDEFSGSKKVNKFDLTFSKLTFSKYSKWVKIPYTKWVISLRQYRKGLLQTEDGTKTIRKTEWRPVDKSEVHDSRVVNRGPNEWVKVKKQVKVSGKPAREFGKWLDSEIRACIQYLRSKKAKKEGKR
jgi:hypothetical protein